MKDKGFVTRTINEGNVHIQQFPTSKIQQLAKKMESSKATATYIRQVAGDLLAAQFTLCTTSIQNFWAEITANRKRYQTKSCQTAGPQNNKCQRNPLISEISRSSLIDVSDVVT